MNKKSLFITLLIISTSNLLSKLTDIQLSKSCTLCEKVCKECQLIGDYPDEICWLIDSFKNGRIRSNRLLLYGDSGNGKTSIGEIVAKLTDSEICHLKMSDFAIKYDGMQEVYKKLQEIADYDNSKKIVLFLDELNILADYVASTNPEEYSRALAVFCCFLDKCEYNSTIFIIFATDTLNHFNDALLKRFEYKIQIKNPKENDRKKILQYYANEYHANLTPEQIDDITENSHGLSREALRTLIHLLKKWRAENNSANIDPFSSSGITDEMIAKQLADAKAGIKKSAEKTCKKHPSHTKYTTKQF